MRIGERAGLKEAKPMRDIFGEALLEVCTHDGKVMVSFFSFLLCNAYYQIRLSIA